MTQESRQARRLRERQSRGEENASNPTPLTTPPRRRGHILIFLLGIILGGGLSFSLFRVKGQQDTDDSTTSAAPQQLLNYADILGAAPEQASNMDIATMNLLCGSKLNGTKGIKINDCLRRLDRLVDMVKKETTRNWQRWEDDPAEYRHSLAYYKMGMLITVVRQDYGAKYNPKLITTPAVNKGKDDGFFKDGRDIFLQGLLSDHKTGTCANMPVLYVAIARRLGYPVHLVAAKGHLFCRWDDGKERMNFEGTGNGIRTDPDERYHKWPFPIGAKELQKGTYLKNLNPQQELAIFLSNRADCLVATGRNIEALTALSQAVHLVQRHGGLSGIMEHIAASPVVPDIVYRMKSIDVLTNDFPHRPNMQNHQPNNPYAPQVPTAIPNNPHTGLPHTLHQPFTPQFQPNHPNQR